MPVMIVGVPFTQVLTASGGTPAYTYVLAGGALPAGLSLAAATISGTPTTAGPYAFTIRATDSAALTVERAYSGQVLTSAIAILPDSITGLLVGKPYTQTHTASGGTAPYTWAVIGGALPAGLSLAAGTGIVSGTPTTQGAFSFTLRATDNVSKIGTKTYGGTVGANVLTITPTKLPQLIVAASDLGSVHGQRRNSAVHVGRSERDAPGWLSPKQRPHLRHADCGRGLLLYAAGNGFDRADRCRGALWNCPRCHREDVERSLFPLRPEASAFSNVRQQVHDAVCSGDTCSRAAGHHTFTALRTGSRGPWSSRFRSALHSLIRSTVSRSSPGANNITIDGVASTLPTKAQIYAAAGMTLSDKVEPGPETYAPYFFRCLWRWFLRGRRRDRHCRSTGASGYVHPTIP